MKTIGERIQNLIETKEISKAELGRLLGGYSGQLIGQYIAGRQKPKAEFYDKWIETFGHDLRETNVSRGKSPLKVLPKEHNVSSIPFYDAVAVGGASMLAEQQAVYQPTEMIDPGTWFRSATGALRVYGHSMFPKYPAGSIIAFKQADMDVIIWGEDYVIELEDRRIVKRLDKCDVPDCVKAVSYNKSEEYQYAPIEIPKRKIKRLYMVLGKVELEASV